MWAELDTSVAHSARLWNYLLGGKDNFAADREAAEQVLAVHARAALQSARSNRQFLGRAVRHLAGEAGIRQFLDIGTGLPTADNTHEVAQAIAPESRIVYVDNDPMVLVHARALLTSSPEGATDYIDADLRDPAADPAPRPRQHPGLHPAGRGHADRHRHFILDDDEAVAIVRTPDGRRAVRQLPRHVPPDPRGQRRRVDRAVEMWNGSGAAPMAVRDPQQIAALLHGLDLLDPGVVTCSQWRPDGNDTTPASEFSAVGPSG